MADVMIRASFERIDALKPIKERGKPATQIIDSYGANGYHWQETKVVPRTVTLERARAIMPASIYRPNPD